MRIFVHPTAARPRLTIAEERRRAPDCTMA
jgi:hypothetical protein